MALLGGSLRHRQPLQHAAEKRDEDGRFDFHDAGPEGHAVDQSKDDLDGGPGGVDGPLVTSGTLSVKIATCSAIAISANPMESTMPRTLRWARQRSRRVNPGFASANLRSRLRMIRFISASPAPAPFARSE